MIFTRSLFFIFIFSITVAPFIVYKLFWILRSKQTAGIASFTSKEYLGQLPRQFAVIKFYVNKDTIWFHGIDNQLFAKGQPVQVRYQRSNPSDARVDNFKGLWIDTLIYISPALLVIIIAYLHPDLVPRGSKIRINRKKPFLWIV
ncbi:MAG: hypothetical protein INR73_08185 [Williamsia sp.]|nr:hypothetical protein [Williamsia sp.]